MEILVTNQPKSEEYDEGSRRQFTVIGSGVIGLLVAHELTDQGHQVNVISQEGMPNENSGETSSIAGGQFLPWLPSGHAEVVMRDIGSTIGDIIEYCRGFYAELAHCPETTGVMRISNVELINDSTPWPSGLPEAMKVELTQLPNPISIINPNGDTVEFTDKYVFDTFSINTRKTIAWLARQALIKGVAFTKLKLEPGDLERLDGTIINATGAGAKELTGDPDILHYKGHTIVIKPKQGQRMPVQVLSVDDLIIIPREDGTVTVGALYIDSPDRQLPEFEEAKRLFRRLTDLIEKTSGLVEGLEPELLTEGEILLHQAGYRVVIQSGGIRVAHENNILHAYGFSGIGWSVGPAFARQIASQAVEMYEQRNDETL